MKSGSGTSIEGSRSNDLGDRDRLILDDIELSKMTTNEFVLRQFMPNAKPNAVVKVTGRLIQQGWINAFPLFDRQKYFVLGSSTIKLRGLSTSKSRPLGPQTLASAYAIKKYFARTDPSLRLATDVQLQERFMWMDKPQLNTPQAIESNGSEDVLRIVRVDLGGPPKYIAKKCIRDLSSRQTKPEFNQLVSSSRVVLVVITSSEQKQDHIKTAIAKTKWPNVLRFQVYVVPELFHFLAK